MPSKTFNNSDDAYNYAKKHTRYKIKTGQTLSKLTDKQREAGMKPEVTHHYRVITYNRDKEVN